MARHTINQKKHKGGKIKGGNFEPAAGNSADTGTPVSLPPVKKFTAPDVISAPRQPVNAPTRTPVSVIPPGFSSLTPLGEVLKQDGDDGTLDKIISGENIADPQLRELAPGNVPVRAGMVRQQNPDLVFGKKT